MLESPAHARAHRRARHGIVGLALLGALLAMPTLPFQMQAQRAAGPITIPAGTTILVKTVSEVSSKMPAGARFETRLENDLYVDGHLITPAGTALYGIITRSEGGKQFGKQQLATTLNELSWNGHLVPIVSDTAGVEAKPGGGLLKIGGGRLVGAAIAGGPGAMVGGAVGGVVSRKGQKRHITIPAGKTFEVHLRAPLHLP
jgi:hypothetical protein